MSDRNALLRLLHVRKREASVGDDDYRNRLEREFGKRSAKDLSDAQLARAVEMFPVKQKANNAYTAKIRALFIAAHNLAAVESGSDAALDALVKRQTGKERLGFVTPAEANTVTEALKAILARAGFVVPPSDAGGVAARCALVKVQWMRLHGLDRLALGDEWKLEGYARKVCPGAHRGLDHFSKGELDKLARVFGAQLRRAAPSAKGAAK